MSLFAQEAVRGAEASDEPLGTVLLADGSLLRGHPEGGAGEDKVTWKLKAVEAPLTLPLSAMVEMRLPGKTAPERPDVYQARVRLTNGDLLLGPLTGLSETHLEIDTWHAGVLRLKRTMVSDLEIVAPSEAIYVGPTDFESWVKTPDKGAWKMEGGALVSSAGAIVARKVELPAKCRISFDLGWSGSLRCRVLFFSDKGATAQPDNCYDVVCQRRFIYLRKRWLTGESGGSRIVGQGTIPALAENEEAQLDFYFDRDAGTIGLYVNREKVMVWTDQEPKVGAFGNWFHLISEDFYPLRVSRIRMSEWNGELPADVVPAEEAPNWKGTEDGVQLQDGTLLSGELRAIREGVFRIHSDGQEKDVPIAKIRAIKFGSGGYEEPRRKKGDIRAWTPDGGRITFRLDAFGPEILKGHSGIFGDAEFQRAAFSRLDFNLYDEALEELRDQRE